jgi:RimJ/RimL family protein N-acetyltransferase
MINDIFRGRLVRLVAQDPETISVLLARWSHDSEFLRLLDSDPARPKTREEYQAKETQRLERANAFAFNARALEGDRLIGFVGLWVHSWTSGEAYVGIGIGEPSDRGRGYGTDTMRLVLRYAFAELNLARVSLEALAHNTRAIRSYEKAGFRLEGVQREWDRRDGQRWDIVFMGILAADYVAQAQAGLSN